jgi:hypothetical protein
MDAGYSILYCGDDLEFHVSIVNAGLAGRERGCGKAVMQYEAGA